MGGAGFNRLTPSAATGPRWLPAGVSKMSPESIPDRCRNGMPFGGCAGCCFGSAALAQASRKLVPMHTLIQTPTGRKVNDSITLSLQRASERVPPESHRKEPCPSGPRDLTGLRVGSESDPQKSARIYAEKSIVSGLKMSFSRASSGFVSGQHRTTVDPQRAPQWTGPGPRAR